MFDKPVFYSAFTSTILNNLTDKQSTEDLDNIYSLDSYKTISEMLIRFYSWKTEQKPQPNTKILTN